MARTITIDVKGIAEAKKALGAAFAHIERQIAVAVMDLAEEIKEDVRYAIVRGPKTGVTYWRVPGKDGVMRIYAGNPKAGGGFVAAYRTDGPANLSLTHRASAPGQAPASDTGTLTGSIYVERRGEYAVTVGSRLAYAAYLEFGTRKIAKRPAWIPAIEKNRPEFEAEINRIIANAIR